jgi:hypothetical protein
MDLPLVCTLTEEELRERRRTVLDSIRGATLEVTSVADGYSYRFQPSSDALTQLSRLVDMERQCCRFLGFKIITEPGGQPIRLEISGPPEAKSIIAQLFGSPSGEAEIAACQP